MPQLLPPMLSPSTITPKPKTDIIILSLRTLSCNNEQYFTSRHRLLKSDLEKSHYKTTPPNSLQIKACLHVLSAYLFIKTAGNIVIMSPFTLVSPVNFLHNVCCTFL